MAYGALDEFAQSVPFLSWITGPLARGAQFNDIMEQLKQAQDEYNAIQLPQFSRLPYQAQQFNPSLYENPESATYETIKLDPNMRDAQMSALRRMYDQGEGYAGAQMEADRRRAIMDANQMAKSREGAALMNAQARGVGGSGLAIALGQQGSQDSANRAMTGGLEAAQQAAMQRMMAAQNYSQGLGQLRNQDTDLGARNADIINRFNALNTQARNAAKMGNVDIRNRAGTYNTDNTNQGRMYNMDRSDRNAMNLSNFALNKQNAKYGTTRDMVNAMQGKSKQDIDTSSKDRAEMYKVISLLNGGGGGFGGF